MATHSPDNTILYIRPPYRSSKKTYITKLSLRITSVVLGTVVLGLLIALQLHDVDMPLLIMGPGVICGLCWSFSETICLFVRHDRNGITPGAIVGCDLVLWLAMSIATAITGFMKDGYYWQESTMRKQINRKVVTAAVLVAAIDIVIHFALFTIGCREVNAQKQIPKAAYVRMDSLAVPPPSYPGRDVELQPVNKAVDICERTVEQ